jgi:hypothetical protein
LDNHRSFSMPYATVYPLYVKKAERKGRTQMEVDEVIRWLVQLVDELSKGWPMAKILRGSSPVP